MAKNIGTFGFQGGLNTKATTNTLGKDQMTDAQDVILYYGDLMKRKGSSALNSAISGTPAMTGLADWQIASGQRYAMATAGNKIFKMEDLDGTWDDITGAVTITSGQNNQSTWASLNNIVVRCGGTTPDAPVKWTGTGNAAALGGSPPSGNLCYTVNNFLFIAGTAANPSRVNWSNVSDPETWGASDFVDYSKSDGDRVTALSGIDQSLVIFKRRKIAKLDTTPPSTAVSVTLGPLYTVINGIGCVGGQAVDTFPSGDIVFLGSNAHVYIFDGSSLVDISDQDPPKSNIQPTLDALPVSRLPFAVVKVYPTRNQVWLSVSTASSTTNDSIFVFDYNLGVWVSKFTKIAANVMSVNIDSRAVPSHPFVLLSGNYAGVVYEQDKGSSNPEDANSNIDGYGTTSVQLSGDAQVYAPRSMMLLLEAQNTMSNVEINYGFNGINSLNLSTSVNQKASGAALGSFLLGTDVLGGSPLLRRPVLLYASNKNSSIQLQFRNRNGGEDFQIHPFWLSDDIMV